MRKILHIEDNPNIRENLEELLELSNFEVITASYGKEGISEIILQDTLRRTSKGNWFIQIDVLNLRIPKDFPEFELYDVKWIHPAPPDGILGVMRKGKIIREY